MAMPNDGCGPKPGKTAVRVPIIAAKSGSSKAARVIRARSYTEVCWPGPSNPDTVAALVSSAPRAAAIAFMSATVFAVPPLALARAWAASLPEFIIMPRISSRTV